MWLGGDKLDDVHPACGGRDFHPRIRVLVIISSRRGTYADSDAILLALLRESRLSEASGTIAVCNPIILVKGELRVAGSRVYSGDKLRVRYMVGSLSKYVHRAIIDRHLGNDGPCLRESRQLEDTITELGVSVESIPGARVHLIRAVIEPVTWRQVDLAGLFPMLRDQADEDIASDQFFMPDRPHIDIRLAIDTWLNQGRVLVVENQRRDEWLAKEMRSIRE